MLEAIENSIPEFASSGFSEADQGHAMQMGISFHRTQFVYRDFKYDCRYDRLVPSPEFSR